MDELAVWTTLILAADSVIATYLRGNIGKELKTVYLLITLHILMMVYPILLVMFHVEQFPLPLFLYHTFFVLYNTIYMTELNDDFTEVILNIMD